MGWLTLLLVRSRGGVGAADMEQLGPALFMAGFLAATVRWLRGRLKLVEEKAYDAEDNGGVGDVERWPVPVLCVVER